MWDSDFAILTIVPEAWQSAIELFGASNYEDRAGIRYAVSLVGAQDGGQHLVVIAQATDRSNVPAARATEAMLRAWKPRHFIVADIGGGFWSDGPTRRDGLNVGDVIVASDIEYFEVEKEVPDSEPLGRGYAMQLPTPGPRNAIRSLADFFADWYQPAQQLRLGAAEVRAPLIIDGQIICGEKLLSDPNSDLVKRLVKKYDKALGLDMESAGVGRAVLDLQGEEIFTQFVVLRGVSDLVNKIEGNQETRDEWKPFAARASIAAAHTWIVSCSTSHGTMATGRSIPASLAAARMGHVQELPPAYFSDIAVWYPDRLRKWLTDAAAVAPRSFCLALEATDYRTAPSAAPPEGETIERGVLVNLSLDDGKVVVVGPSGAGKSNLLRQVLRQVAVADELPVVFLDLKEKWDRKWTDGLVENPDPATVTSSMHALLNASAIPLSESHLAELSSKRTLLLIVDALNEVPTEVAEKIRRTLDEYVRCHPSVRVLASDRRKGVYHELFGWTVLHLAGATEEEARDVVDEEFGPGIFADLDETQQRLLSVPFFLDLALRVHNFRLGSQANAVEDFLRDAGLREPEEMVCAAEVGFEVYRRGETFTLSDSDIEKLEAKGLRHDLEASEVLSRGSNGLIFAHQLVHQFLAGHHLAANPEKWTPETLDRVTADAASLDGIGMTMAAIADEGKRDRFLRIVYDWNWRAAVSALIDARTGDRSVSEALATAVLALAAEKRFDPVSDTRSRVVGLLAEVPGPIAEGMRDIPSYEQLLDDVSHMEFPDVDWWTSWREVFVWDAGRELTHTEVALIGSSEPLMGWTVSNSLRRFQPSDQLAVLLQTIYLSQLREEPGARVTRWRVVHALGAWPTQANADFLLETLNFETPDDLNIWVVYGATRSLVEMAARARDPALRSFILGQLSERSYTLQPGPLGRIFATAAYRDADREWPETVRPLLISIRDQQTAGERERERWDRRIEVFDEYARDRAARDPLE